MSIFDEGPQDQEARPPVRFTVTVPHAEKEGWRPSAYYGTYAAVIDLRRGDHHIRAFVAKDGTSPMLRGEDDEKFRPAAWCIDQMDQDVRYELRSEADRLREEWIKSGRA